MKGKRSTRVLTLGLAVFVAGTALTFIGLRSGDAKPAPAAKQAAAPITTAAAPVKGAPVAQAPSPVTLLPDGMEAVAVQLPYVPGVAGYVRAGDLINVYATIKNGPTQGKLKNQPLAKLTLTNVRVVDVRAPLQGTEGNVTFLLALSAKDAEQVVFLSRYESLWFTLVKPKAKPASTTGRAYTNVL
jgi:Flp pilus assembly protein CpaB